MAFQSRVHPTPSLPLSESNNLAHQINFFTPYEDVNLANLFTNVQITEDDRIFVPSDPFSDHFVPFGSLTYLEANNIFHSSLHNNESDKFEEELFLKNPPNSPEQDSPLVYYNSFDPLLLEKSSDSQVSEATGPLHEVIEEKESFSFQEVRPINHVAHQPSQSLFPHSGPPSSNSKIVGLPETTLTQKRKARSASPSFSD